MNAQTMITICSPTAFRRATISFVKLSDALKNAGIVAESIGNRPVDVTVKYDEVTLRWTVNIYYHSMDPLAASQVVYEPAEQGA